MVLICWYYGSLVFLTEGQVSTADILETIHDWLNTVIRGHTTATDGMQIGSVFDIGCRHFSVSLKRIVPNAFKSLIV